jgi:hypothetical protein
VSRAKKQAVCIIIPAQVTVQPIHVQTSRQKRGQSGHPDDEMKAAE